MADELRNDPASTGRRLMRSADRATLATVQQGWPYASLVLVALDHSASPLLLLSNLAEHTKNIKREPRISLMFDGTAGLADPLTGARVTVQGEISATADAQLRARFLARHPSAAAYAGFADFSLYRVAVARAHLVAGFGRIDWIESAALLYTDATQALVAAESDIIKHMNEDHAEAIELYARKIAGCAGTGWRLTGVDPEGIDLRGDGTAMCRVDFAKPVRDAEGARVELARLARMARRRA